MSDHPIYDALVSRTVMRGLGSGANPPHVAHLTSLSRALYAPRWTIEDAAAMDRVWPEPRETAGYFVTAQRR